jgi:hypothetical protein
MLFLIPTSSQSVKGHAMQTRLSALLFSLFLAAAVPGAASAADAHRHDHGSADTPKLQLNAGKKWTTDKALRQTMNEINLAMGEALPLIHRDSFDNEQYRRLATVVTQKVAYAVENCKLDPKADAMLHLVIADLLGGTETMEGKQPGSRHDGAVQVMQALQAYGKYFQHPGWKLARG